MPCNKQEGIIATFLRNGPDLGVIVETFSKATLVTRDEVNRTGEVLPQILPDRDMQPNGSVDQAQRRGTRACFAHVSCHLARLYIDCGLEAEAISEKARKTWVLN